MHLFKAPRKESPKGRLLLRSFRLNPKIGRGKDRSSRLESPLIEGSDGTRLVCTYEIGKVPVWENRGYLWLLSYDINVILV